MTDRLSFCSKFLIIVIPLACAIYSVTKIIMILPNIEKVVGQLYINLSLLVSCIVMPAIECFIGIYVLWKDKISRPYIQMEDPSFYVARRIKNGSSSDK